MGRPPIIERAARERVRLRTGEIMETMYPAGPASVPAQLTAPSAAYKRHAWLAMAGLLAFVSIYFALLGWFGWTAYRLLASIVRGSTDNVVLAAGAGICAAFLCVFMAKALVFPLFLIYQVGVFIQVPAVTRPMPAASAAPRVGAPGPAPHQ